MNVGTFYELLDRLPERCDDFKVRFTLHDRTNWIQPECWHVDDDGDLILTLWDDDEDHDDDEYTIDRLKDLLDGYWNDECDEDQEIYDWREVYIEDFEWIGNGDQYGPRDRCNTYYDILDDRFEINWKRERVDVFIEYN